MYLAYPRLRRKRRARTILRPAVLHRDRQRHRQARRWTRRCTIPKTATLALACRLRAVACPTVARRVHSLVITAAPMPFNASATRTTVASGVSASGNNASLSAAPVPRAQHSVLLVKRRAIVCTLSFFPFYGVNNFISCSAQWLLLQCRRATGRMAPFGLLCAHTLRGRILSKH